MTPLYYSDIAAELGGRLHGADGVVENVSTDTRALRVGDLFIALKGEHFDAHQFLDTAVEGGAAALMVQHARGDVDLPQIVVDDTRRGLGMLAQLWRKQFNTLLIAVTGSNGKTTVKEMLAAILSRLGETLVTQGNLNNDIGVPLTLLRLRERHRYAVVEMGANHHGEIAYLTQLAGPQTALITNAGPAHLEGFGSIEAVAEAKGEIYEGLADGGHAVINADDRFAPLWRDLSARCRQLEFSMRGEAAVRGRWNARTNRLTIETRLGRCELELPLRGEHNARNALAAAAAALTAGAGLEEIRQGLKTIQPVPGRLCTHRGVQGSTVIDDTYNANPASLQAALDVVTAMPGEAWLVLGDMGELGAGGRDLHAQMGEAARQSGIRRFFALGALSAAAAEAFGAGAEAFEDWEQLTGAVRDALHADVNLLVKGSRAMRMERVVAELIEAPAPASMPSAAGEH